MIQEHELINMLERQTKMVFGEPMYTAEKRAEFGLNDLSRLVRAYRELKRENDHLRSEIAYLATGEEQDARD